MKQDIIVIGIHEGHNTGAAFIKNGTVVAAIQEERLNKEKNFSGIPVLSISKVFDIAKIDPSDVNRIAIVGLLKHTFFVCNKMMKGICVPFSPKGRKYNKFKVIK